MRSVNCVESSLSYRQIRNNDTGSKKEARSRITNTGAN